MEMASFIKNKSIFIFLSALVITACGGEQKDVDNTTTSSASLNSSSLYSPSSVSSSSSTSTSASVYSGPIESTAAVSSSSIKALSFSEAGPIYIAVNEYFHNIAASGNSGSVTYTSSNVNVATVNEEGYINVVSKGEVVITAIQDKASVNYSLIIVPKSVNFSVWLNGNNEKINIPSELNGGELYISDNINCTYSNYQGCRADQKYIINGNTIVATKNHSNSKPRVLLNNEYWAVDVPDNKNNIQPVVDHSVFVFNDKLWRIGGHSKNYLDMWLFQEYSNYIWSTIDGVNWIKEPATQLPFLSQHQVTSFNNKLWLFGGTEHISDNDNWKAIYKQTSVWSSTDGINWVKVSENSASFFCGDTNLVSFKNKLWRFGGCDSNYAYSTIDGINWVQEATSPTLLNRFDHRVIVFNNKLLLIGGVVGAQYRNDIWSSDDGVSWVLVKEHAEFSERQAPSLINFNNKLWLSGGRKGDENYFDTWSSLDGINWLLEGERSENGPLIFFKNEIWTIGGYDKSNVFEVLGTNATSKSSDGINWWHLDKRSFNFTRPYINK